VSLSATIGQRTEACLVNTGCQLRLPPERLASPYSRQIGPQRLLAANGTPIEVFGRVTLSIKLNGYPFTISFLVTSDVGEIMLGMDFLSTQAHSSIHGATITCMSSSSEFYVLYSGFPSRMSTASARTHGCSCYCSELPDKSDCLCFEYNTRVSYTEARSSAWSAQQFVFVLCEDHWQDG
jgi:hypothetical protein